MRAANPEAALVAEHFHDASGDLAGDGELRFLQELLDTDTTVVDSVVTVDTVLIDTTVARRVPLQVAGDYRRLLGSTGVRTLDTDPAAIDRIQGQPATHVQRADAFGAVEFVRAERHHIHAERLDIQRQIGCGLDSIGVEENVVLCANFSDLLDWVDRTNLIIGIHHRHQYGFIGNSSLQFIQINISLPINR